MIIVSIPTGIIGLALKDYVEQLLYRPKVVALMLLVTAIVVYLVDRIEGQHSIQSLSPKGIVLIGSFQGLAVIPGISRSGSTIFATLLAGAKREEAAPFSFIVSIPAISGGTILELAKVNKEAYFDTNLLIGMLVAFFSGLLALHMFIRLLKRRKFVVFSTYLLLVSLAVLVLG